MAKLKATTYSYLEGDTPEQLMEKYRDLQTSTGKSYTLQFIYDVKRSKHIAYYYATIEVQIDEFKDENAKEVKIDIRELS